MPNGGSVNQIEPSDFTTTSLGEFSGLPSNFSATTVIVPSYSVRLTRRASCSHVTRRPWRSRVLPLELFDGLRKTVTAPVSSSHFMMRLFGMSLHSRYRPSPNHTGPSLQRQPSAIFSILAKPSLYLLNAGSMARTSGSGYRWLGCHCCPIARDATRVAVAAPVAARNWRRVGALTVSSPRVKVERQTRFTHACETYHQTD